MFRYLIVQYLIQQQVNECTFNQIQRFRWIVTNQRKTNRACKKRISSFLVATSPAEQQRTAVNSPASMQDNYEAMTPTQASINQQQIAATNFNGRVKHMFSPCTHISIF